MSMKLKRLIDQIRVIDQHSLRESSQSIRAGWGVKPFFYLCFHLRTVLKHQDLDGKIKTACLGSLLRHDHLEPLEDQYLSHKEVKTNLTRFRMKPDERSNVQNMLCPSTAWKQKVSERAEEVFRVFERFLLQDQVKLWLRTALKIEEDSWRSGDTPELIDTYYFSPLAADVIQVRDRWGTGERQVRHRWETGERQVRDRWETGERQVRDRWETGERQMRQVRDRWETDERQMRDRWETGERQMRDRWETGERQMRDRWETGERQMRDRWETGERQMRDRWEIPEPGFTWAAERLFRCLCFQVINSSVTEFHHVIRDQSKIQRITAHLERFLHR